MKPSLIRALLGILGLAILAGAWVWWHAVQSTKSSLGTPVAGMPSPPQSALSQLAGTQGAPSAHVLLPAESYESLSKVTADDLWKRWLAGIAAPGKRNPLLGPALAAKLRESTPEITTLLDMAFGFLTKSGQPELQQITLAKILGESGNPEALQILLESLQVHAGSRYEHEVLDVISGMGHNHYPGRDLGSLQDIASEYWGKFSSGGSESPYCLAALAKVVAETGLPESMEFLLGQAEAAGGNPNANQTATPSNAALMAAHYVRNPGVVPLLKERLSSSDPGSGTFLCAGEALAAMGRPEATASLLDWARNAPASMADTAARWLNQVRDTRSGQLLREAAANPGTIRDPAIRSCVTAAAKNLAF